MQTHDVFHPFPGFLFCYNQWTNLNKRKHIIPVNKCVVLLLLDSRQRVTHLPEAHPSKCPQLFFCPLPPVFSPMAEIEFNPKPLHPFCYNVVCALKNNPISSIIISWHHQKSPIHFPSPAMLNVNLFIRTSLETCYKQKCIVCPKPQAAIVHAVRTTRQIDTVQNLISGVNCWRQLLRLNTLVKQLVKTDIRKFCDKSKQPPLP